MSKPKKITTVRTVEDVDDAEVTTPAVTVDGPADASAVAESRADEELADVLSGLAGTAGCGIKIYRKVANQPLVYVGQCDPATFSMDDLRDKFGGGTFQLFITRNRALYRNITVSVEKPVTPSASVAPSTDIVSVMRMHMEDMQRTYRDMLEIVAGNKKAEPNYGEQMMQMAALIKSVAAPPPPVTSPWDELSKMLGLVERLRGEQTSTGDREPSLMDIARDFVRSPMLGAAIQSMIRPVTHATNTAAPVGSPAALRAPANVAPAVSPNPLPPSEVPMPANSPDLNDVRRHLQTLCDAAARQSDPGIYADLIVDLVDPAVLNGLLNSDPMTQLIAAHPPVGQHREWFGQLIALLKEDDPGNAPPVTPDDDPPDPSGASA